MLHAVGDTPGGGDGNVRIVADDLHAQIDCRVGHERADGAQAHDAELLAEDLATGKCLLRLFGRLADGGVVGVFAAPDGAVDDAAAAEQHAGDDELLHGIGIGAGGVEDDDALIGATIERNVVHTGAGARNGQQAGRELGLVQLGAANEDAVGLREVVDELVAGGQLVGALLRDVVEAVDARHVGPFACTLGQSL